MAFGSIYPFNIIENIIDKGFWLGNISFFNAMYSNCPLEFIQNFLMIYCFIKLSCFLSTLSILWIFYLKIAKYRKYFIYFVAFIKII